VTMRGLERPGGVKWTRPFLPPLEPLDALAARQIYIDIADEPIMEQEEADSLLLANTASFEGSSATLARYRVENTDMLSQGYDKRSNLHKSIKNSLCRRRITGIPDAIMLLSLLSLLPDGVSTTELLRCDKHIRDIWRCKSTLIRTSLAFIGPDGRVRVLVPIREYMQRFHPPIQAIMKPFWRYLGSLLRVWTIQRGLESTQVIANITINLGNIRSVMKYGCDNFAEDMTDIGFGILELDAFLFDIYGGCTDLFLRVLDVIERTGEQSLEALRICGPLQRHPSEVPNCDAGALVSQGIKIFRSAIDPVGEGAH
ncbi:hypothetical protein DFH08DRAFT_708295, partial [Mycena albidolilacea]